MTRITVVGEGVFTLDGRGVTVKHPRFSGMCRNGELIVFDNKHCVYGPGHCDNLEFLLPMKMLTGIFFQI